MRILPYSDGRQLIKVPAKHQLQPTKGTRIVAHAAADERQLVEQLSGEHGDFIDYEDLALLPALRGRSTATDLYITTRRDDSLTRDEAMLRACYFMDGHATQQLYAGTGQYLCSELILWLCCHTCSDRTSNNGLISTRHQGRTKKQSLVPTPAHACIVKPRMLQAATPVGAVKVTLSDNPSDSKTSLITFRT
jgi:hypothetical protein